MIASYTQVIDGVNKGTGLRYDGFFWNGLTIIDNRIYKFKTIDLTDYDNMCDNCPCCSSDDEDINLCHCVAYKELICILNFIEE